MEKILAWIGGIFAGIGIVLLVCDLVRSIKKRDKMVINIVGLIFLSMAVIGYVITDLVKVIADWSPLASLIWIVLFWVYVILDCVVTLGHYRKYRREKRQNRLMEKHDEIIDRMDAEVADDDILEG